MTKIEEWIATKIDECKPSGTRGRAGVEDLMRALLFFEGKASQIFGMAAERASMPEVDTLRAACASAIRGWFEEFGRSDVAAQVNLFEVATRHGLPLDLPEPASVTAARALERERTRALAEYGRPSDTLPKMPSLAGDLARVWALSERVSFRAIAKYVSLPNQLSMSQFEWFSDEWSSVAQAGLEPAFFPLAGADGDYLGLVLDADLLHEQQVPLVYYFHEHDPVYTWVFESCATAVQVLLAAEAKQPRKSVSRGIEHEPVTAFLREMSDPGEARDASNTRALSRRWLWEGARGDEVAVAFERAGNAFAVRNILAQRIWREFEEKIRAARPARG